jgi:hypothetical protein
MNHKFDELAKGLAQSVTRREAFKRFGVGLAGMALACFGLANRAEAGNKGACLSEGSVCGYPGGGFYPTPCCPPYRCKPVLGFENFAPICQK